MKWFITAAEFGIRLQVHHSPSERDAYEHILWKLGMSSYPLLGDAVVSECVKQQSAMQAM